MKRAGPLSPLDQRLGERLRQARLQVLLTQDDVAQVLAVDRSTLAKWELGQRRMTAYDLFQMATLYRVPLEQLVDLEKLLPRPASTSDTRPAATSPSDQAQQLIRQFLEQRPELLPDVLTYIEHLATAPSHTPGSLPSQIQQALRHIQSLDLNQVAPMMALQLLMSLQHTIEEATRVPAE